MGNVVYTVQKLKDFTVSHGICYKDVRTFEDVGDAVFYKRYLECCRGKKCRIVKSVNAVLDIDSEVIEEEVVEDEN